MYNSIRDNRVIKSITGRFQTQRAALRISVQNWIRIFRLARLLVTQFRSRPPFIHLMHRNKVTSPFIRNIPNENNEHLFVVIDCFGDTFPLPASPHMLLVPTMHGNIWNALLRRVARRSIVIVHGLFFESTFSFLSLYKGPTYWVIWGGDLYQYRDSPPPQRTKEIASRLSGLLTGMHGDADLFRQIFNISKPYWPVRYFSPITFEDIRPYLQLQRDIIQVNNSACHSSIEVFEALSQVDRKRDRICTVLSYGDDIVSSAVRDNGLQLHGEQFFPLETLLSPTEYARHLCQVKVMIMNQRRQQGVGTLYIGLATGAVIYLRSDVSTWSYLKEMGATVLDTIELLKNPESLIHQLPAADVARNREIGKLLLSVTDTSDVWNCVFQQLTNVCPSNLSPALHQEGAKGRQRPLPSDNEQPLTT